MIAAKRKKKVAYTYSELSEEAKVHAVKAWRESHEEQLFDEADADSLTELFKTDLDDHYGLGDDLEVGWSLSYSQGDGVCFWGSIDVEKFIRTQGLEARFGDLIGRVHANIMNENRQYCHWNSMDVEVESDVDFRAFFPSALLNEYEDFRVASQRVTERRVHADYMRDEPIRKWEEEVRRIESEQRQRERRARKQDWFEREREELPPKPGRAEVEKPPPMEMPARLEAEVVRAEQAYTEFETLMSKFGVYLDEQVKEISRKLEETGYAEIEYHNSDEYIQEFLEGNEIEFTEDGELLE